MSRSIRPLLCGLAGCLLWGGGTVAVLAQQPEVVLETPAQVLQPTDIEATRYWVVSSRNCPEDGSDRDGRCLRYFRHVGPRGFQATTPAELLATLQPQLPVCVMTHGSFIDWRSAVIDAELTYRWLRTVARAEELQLVCFTWPSDQDLTALLPVDINRLTERGMAHSPHLAQFLLQLPPTTQVCLIGHSHGALVTAGALHLLGGGVVSGVKLPGDPDPVRQYRTVFAAAAFDHDWLNPQRPFCAALGRTEGVLNLRNNDDLALNLYPLRSVFGAESFGRTGLTWSDQRVQGAQASKVIDLDVSRFLQTDHLWTDYVAQADLARAVVPYALFREIRPLAVRPPAPSVRFGRRPQPAAAPRTEMQSAPNRRTGR